MNSRPDVEKLALAVIKTAIKDAINSGKTKKLRKYKREAIDFLTIPNEDFKMWCNLANLSPKKVHAETKKVATNPEFWHVILKQLDSLE